jgi:pyruvate/2-oxoglutarate/acetoin dehydrogenase E1 component
LGHRTQEVYGDQRLSPFKHAVNAAMRRLADDPRTVFVGQSVRYDGAAVYDSLDGVPMEQRIEMPVVEDFQMGFCTGLALMGKLPICIFPRFDFVLLAANQLVNHLDKLPRFGWHPKVIIRTCVGQKTPLDAGPQHTQNHTYAFSHMLKTVRVHEVRTAEDVERAYDIALAIPYSSLIVENPA